MLLCLLFNCAAVSIKHFGFLTKIRETKLNELVNTNQSMEQLTIMFFLKSILTSSEFLKINSIEGMLLIEFGLLDKSMQIKKIREFLSSANFDLIVKLAHNNTTFRSACLLPEFSKDWESLWSTYGIVITADPKKALYYQPIIEQFDLFLGIYFYNKALEVSKALKKDSTSIELSYLSLAMKYNSIHAYQRYHVHLYSIIHSRDPALEQENLQLIKKIIRNIMKLIPTYKAYAYFMLAEAYFHYGYSMSSKGNMIVAGKAQNAALTACAKAKEHFSESDIYFFNASLGGTLFTKYCPTMSINFEEIESKVMSSFEEIGEEEHKGEEHKREERKREEHQRGEYKSDKKEMSLSASPSF